MPGPTLLLYNLDGRSGDALKALCRKHRIEWKDVAPADFGQTLGALVGLPSPKGVAGAPAMPFRDAMLVMANLMRPQFDALLQDMRAAGVRVPLKAVLTPANVGWNAYQLHDELAREHEAMARQAKEKSRRLP